MTIYSKLEEIKQLALHSAKKHGRNYNIIIHNHVNGEFKEGESTYEFVRDSYFETDRPNCIILEKTDDLVKKTKVGIVGSSNIHLFAQSLDADDLDKAFGVESEGYLMYSKQRDLDEFKYSHLSKKEREAVIVDVRNTPKINRNAMCECGSGKKFKKCCIKK